MQEEKKWEFRRVLRPAYQPSSAEHTLNFFFLHTEYNSPGSSVVIYACTTKSRYCVLVAVVCVQ